ncbi:MAG: transcription antitermination factor NusB [Prevotella sp.]|nr:transcription antitermination factor NusB [Paraprevotella sp.]MCI6201432.1 transcription antitermination factor NusB [Paraprevotella sp.]MDD5854783.1 transcription antitermination factor NusB [Prevotella sp.]MDD7692473.1 transcription antitermination factor NusB [Prevotella sp.]
MINRELIRIKVLQLTYAYYQNGNKVLDVAEKELMFSLSKAYHLYHHLLSLVVAVSKEARKHYDVETAKATREGTPMPSAKFANNRLALQIEENHQLNEFISTQNQAWEDDIDFVRRLYSQIVQSTIYNEYMASDEDSYDADKEIWRKIYKTLIMNNEDLDAVLEEKSLYWNDDKDIVDTFVLKTIKRFDANSTPEQELLPEFKDEEDRSFARKLFRYTILNADQYQKYMSETSRNWDFSRLAYMDIVIMQIAIAEIINFPNIPVSVSINEYVELAKIYSTPKSAGYINGMLDSIARHLINTGVVLKPIAEKHGK